MLTSRMGLGVLLAAIARGFPLNHPLARNVVPVGPAPPRVEPLPLKVAGNVTIAEARASMKPGERIALRGPRGSVILLVGQPPNTGANRQQRRAAAREAAKDLVGGRNRRKRRALAHRIARVKSADEIRAFHASQVPA